MCLSSLNKRLNKQTRKATTTVCFYWGNISTKASQRSRENIDTSKTSYEGWIQTEWAHRSLPHYKIQRGTNRSWPEAWFYVRRFDNITRVLRILYQIPCLPFELLHILSCCHLIWLASLKIPKKKKKDLVDWQPLALVGVMLLLERVKLRRLSSNPSLENIWILHLLVAGH